MLSASVRATTFSFVADEVAVAIVDQLETVEVGEQHTERTLEALVLLKPASEHGLAEAAIAHARQRVAHRGVQEIRGALAAMGQSAVIWKVSTAPITSPSAPWIVAAQTLTGLRCPSLWCR